MATIRDTAYNKPMRWIAATASLAAVLAAAPRAIADVKSECIDASEAAQNLRDDGKYRLAREKLLTCAREACPDPVEQECLAWLATLDRDAPSLVFAARDTRGHDTTSVRVLLDGHLVAESLDGRPLLVDPGEHTARFEIPDAPAIEQQIIVRVGERNRVVAVTFERKTPAPKPSAPPQAQKTEQPFALPLIIGGVGIASLGAFGYFGWTGKSEIDDLRATCGKTHGCDQSRVDAADRKLLIGDVFLGVGVVSLGVATVMLLSGKSTTAPAGKGALDVRPATSGFVATFSQSF